MPSVSYGSATNALTPAMMMMWRSQAAAEMKLRGRAGSLALALALAPGKDPVKYAASEVVRYSEEWWRTYDAAIKHDDTLDVKALVAGRASAVRQVMAPA